MSYCHTGPAIGGKGRAHTHDIICKPGAPPLGDARITLPGARLFQGPDGALYESMGRGDAADTVTQSPVIEALYSPAVRQASSLLMTYHGYRRNQSIGWGVAWGILGAMFPVATPAIAVAQGFGERNQ